MILTLFLRSMITSKHISTTKFQQLTISCRLIFPSNSRTDIQRLSENEIRFIRTYSLAGNLRLTKIRSIYWRLMLGIFPETFDNWITSLQRLRDQYNNLKTEFTIDPHGSSCIPDDNPLSLNQNVNQTFISSSSTLLFLNFFLFVHYFFTFYRVFGISIFVIKS